MALPKILVLVLAGGKGSRLELLTETRAKPAVPFAGVYRLIDFPLSNCEHSQIADVWVSVQYQTASLSEHLANGRPWDLDRTTGGLMTLPPFQGSEREGFTEGTADGLWRQSELIRGFDPDALVVVSSDAVYKLDYREVAEAHLGSGAEVTMVTTEVAEDDAARYGIVRVGDDGTVIDSVLLPGVRVRAGATVTRAVLDDLVEIGPEAVVGGDGDIALVGRRASVDAGAEVSAGARVPDP